MRKTCVEPLELALNQKLFKRAQMMLEEAKTIDQKYGAPELGIAYVENDLGQTYEFTNQLDNARQCYDTALTIRQQKMRANKPMIAYTYTCIASVDWKQKRLEQALGHLKTALSIYSENLSEAQTEQPRLLFKSRLADINISLGLFSEQQKQYDAALQYYSKAQELKEEMSDAKTVRWLANQQAFSLHCRTLHERRKAPAPIQGKLLWKSLACHATRAKLAFDNQHEIMGQTGQI